jgi:cytochrome c-type biogenesis protein CcmE
MIARRKRMLLVTGIIAGVSLAAWLATKAFLGNVVYSFNPTEIAAGKAPENKRFRLAGMVEKGSVEKVPGTMDVKFLMTDFKHTLRVTYNGILPDLFRDGQGVVAHGRLQGNTFVADEILAKHDEKYMPPEVERALRDNPPPPNVNVPQGSGGT